jgi:hypothetical protein
MSRKILSIIFYIIAGFFCYTTTLLAFIDTAAVKTTTPPPGWLKLVIIGIFAAPALFALLIGLAITRFQRWKRDIGIVFISASGLTSFVTLTFICIFMSPDAKKYMPPDTPDPLTLGGDWVTGAASTAACLVMGVLLVVASTRKRKPAI